RPAIDRKWRGISRSDQQGSAPRRTTEGTPKTSVEISHALAAALALGSGGRKCFPCRGDKRPATPHGFRDAACDAGTLRDLWSRYPGTLIGVATGEAADIDALDLDRKHPEAVDWWATNRHRLPKTRAHRTPSGGLHVIFRHRPGTRCWTGRPVPGVDGRANGGYVIWWPAAGLPVLSDAPLAQWPAWLFDEIQPLRSLAQDRVTIP